jgi:hypothetical protein
MLTLWLVAGGLAVLILILAYFRAVARRQVSTLIHATTEKLTREGVPRYDALKRAADTLRRRSPFNVIAQEEWDAFYAGLQDLQSPVEVASEILQECDRRHNALSLKDPRESLRKAYLKQIEISLSDLIGTAVKIQKRDPGQFPSLGIALLAALNVRPGWRFLEERDGTLLFTYKAGAVPISSQNNGQEVARIVLLREIRDLAALRQDAPYFEARQAARQDLLDNFDSYFDEVFRETLQG